MLVQESDIGLTVRYWSKIRSSRYRTWKRYGGSLHDESTARFQLEPEHAGDEGGYSAQSDGSQRHREQERTSQAQGQSYDPRTMLGFLLL
jgi:hypothetical protein